MTHHPDWFVQYDRILNTETLVTAIATHLGITTTTDTSTTSQPEAEALASVPVYARGGDDRAGRAEAVLSAVEAIKGTGGAVEIAGVRIEPCDAYGVTATTRERDELSRSLRDVAAERASHAARGYDVAHDDRHNVYELEQLAVRYVNLSGSGRYPDAERGYVSRTSLVKAASLLVAAIDRLDRSEADL